MMLAQRSTDPRPTPLEALEREAPLRRVGVFRALGLGGMLCAAPAFRALRRRLPEARMTLIGLKWARELVARLPGIFDDFVEFPGYPGLPEAAFDPRRFLEFLGGALRRRFDLAVQMHGSGDAANHLARLLGARHAAGFYRPGRYCPEPGLFLPYHEEESEVRRHLRLAEFLGCGRRRPGLEFHVGAEDRARLKRLLPPGLAREPYAVLHPGAGADLRRWPVEGFAQAGDRLKRRGLWLLVTGSAAEGELCARLETLLGGDCVNLAGRTGLGELGAAVAGARLLVTNDTGVGDLACALGTSSVRVFARPEADGWAPLDRRRHRVVYSPFGARPADVLEQIDGLLAEESCLRGRREDLSLP